MFPHLCSRFYAHLHRRCISPIPLEAKWVAKLLNGCEPSPPVTSLPRETHLIGTSSATVGLEHHSTLTLDTARYFMVSLRCSGMPGNRPVGRLSAGGSGP